MLDNAVTCGRAIETVAGPLLRAYTPYEPIKFDYQPFLYGISGANGDLGFIGEEGSRKSALTVARKVAEEIYPGAFMASLNLGGSKHDKIVTIADLMGDVDLVCDGVIFRRGSGIVSSVFVADCAPVAVYGKNHIGLIHFGRPEAVDGVIAEFCQQWFGQGESPDSTIVMVGPRIRGNSYKIRPEEAEQYKQMPHLVGAVNTYGDEPTFSLGSTAIVQFSQTSITADRILLSLFDTYAFPELASKRREWDLHQRPSWRDGYFIGSW
ncbi:MAG: laccase domain-containing protein [Patescibacteria group bacterium]